MIDGSKRLIDATIADMAQYLEENGYIFPKPNGISKPLKGVSELSRYLGVSYNTARSRVSAGQFKEAEFRVGDVLRFDRDKVDEIVRRARD